MFAQALDTQATLEFASDVRHYLSKTPQRELHSKYLYDDVGTALFEVITLLPEYGLTRADERILKANADRIVGRLPSPTVVAELGSGSGRKARWILEALARREFALYYPIDVSAAALHACRNELGTIDSVHMVEIEGTYLHGLREVRARRSEGESLLVLFLGSTIGNFERGPAEAFLREIRALLEPGDSLLLGTDLVKPISQILPAYDDPTGVTAAFNLNLLARINRELGADFDLRRFRHEARYDEAERRIEMHLRSEIDQTVTIRAADFQFTLRAGETIWTESSHKFGLAEVQRVARSTGFVCVEQWVDPEWPFAENLLTVGSP
jgi:L-histidine N-alpha-methyltransferase